MWVIGPVDDVSITQLPLQLSDWTFFFPQPSFLTGCDSCTYCSQKSSRCSFYSSNHPVLHVWKATLDNVRSWTLPTLCGFDMWNMLRTVQLHYTGSVTFKQSIGLIRFISSGLCPWNPLHIVFYYAWHSFSYLDLLRALMLHQKHFRVLSKV